MYIFIGNLPRAFSEFELRRLVERVLMPRGIKESARQVLFQSDRVKRLEFTVFDKISDAGIVRHGQVLIEPDSMGKRVLQRLDNFDCRGQMLSVREFTIRAYHNDRRDLAWRKKQWHGAERRLSERRQPTIEKQPNKDYFM